MTLNKNVFLISGKIHSGKSTVAQLLKKEIESQLNLPTEIMAFATSLKQMAVKAFMPLMNFLNPLFEKVDLHHLITKEENFWENKTEISRRLLVALGNDIGKVIDPLCWAIKTHEQIKESKAQFILISDWRYRDEFEYLDRDFGLNVLRMRVERNLVREDTDVNKSRSETELDSYKPFDYTIINNGTMEELELKVHEFVKKEFDSFR